jgi:CubicO group peptidase (beta-lactamase class C family)
MTRLPTGVAARWEQGMRAARRPQGAVGLDAVDLLAERSMRSGRRVGLVIGCLAGGEQRVAGYGRLRTDTHDTPDGGTIFEIGSITKVFHRVAAGRPGRAGHRRSG